jgi:hypothetical protein
MKPACRQLAAVHHGGLATADDEDAAGVHDNTVATDRTYDWVKCGDWMSPSGNAAGRPARVVPRPRRVTPKFR